MSEPTNFLSAEDILEEYKAPADALDGATLHIAWYGWGDYDGSSFVLYEKSGKLYEVNGSLCSSYGLKGQWEPEETSWEALAMRKLYSDSFSGGVEAQERLDELVKQHLKDDK